MKSDVTVHRIPSYSLIVFKLAVVASLTFAYLSAGATNCTNSTTIPGRIAGEYGVGPDGAATYRIPIEVPAGRNGLQPNLALEYNSRSSDEGAYGVGWALTGKSMIARCNATFALDGAARAADGEDSDQVCLDGRRLSLYAGTHLAHNSEYRVMNDPRDRIVFHTDVDSDGEFTLTRRDGNKMIYRSVQTAYGRRNQGWALSLIVDPHGNTIDFDPTPNTRDDVIEYGGNVVTGLPHTRRVSFYRSSGDPTRLIVVKAREIGLSDWATVREYNLTYGSSASSHQPLLESVKLCDRSDNTNPDDGCLQPTTVDWMHGNSETLSKSNLYHLVANVPMISADVDADGQSEFVTVLNSEWVIHNWDRPPEFVGGPENGTIHTGIGYQDEVPFAVDFDGDGRDNIVLFSRANNTLQVVSQLQEHTPPTVSLSGFCQGGGGFSPMHAADVTGDGRPNLVGICSITGGGTIYYSLECEATQQSECGAFFIRNLGTLIEYDPVLDNTFALVDLDGDGVATASRMQRQGNEFCRLPVADPDSDPLLPCDDDLLQAEVFVDLDGDGFPTHVRSRMGGTWLGNTPLSLPSFPSADAIRIADLNNDGAVDFVFLHPDTANSTIEIYWNRPGRHDHFSESDKTTIANATCYPRVDDPTYCDANAGGLRLRKTDHIQIVDTDGDGNLEITGRTPYAPNVVSLWEFEASPRNVISKIHDGANEPTFHYTDAVMGDGVYERGVSFGCTYPQHCEPAVGAVVERVVEGTTGLETTMQYFDARSDVRGFGWLGFARVQSQTVVGDVTTTTLEQFANHLRTDSDDYLFRGRTLLTTTTTSSSASPQDRYQTSVQREHEAMQIIGGAMPILSRETRTRRTFCTGCSASGVNVHTSTTDYAYGAFLGDLQNTFHTFEDGETLETNIVFTHDWNMWILSQPAEVTTTHTIGGRTSTRTTHNTFDDKGALTRSVVEPGDGSLELTTDYIYDALGLLFSVHTTGGTTRDTVLQYGANKIYPSQSINAMGHVDELKFNDAYGVLERHLDPNGIERTWTHDTFGRPLTESLEGALQWERCYASTPNGGMQIETKSSSSPPTLEEEDRFGNIIRTKQRAIDGHLAVVSQVYDDRGLMVSRSAPFFEGASSVYQTTYDHDALGRVTSVTEPGGRVTSYSYGLYDDTITVDPPGELTTTTRRFDGRGRMTSTVDALTNTSVNYEYGPFDTVLRRYDNRGNTWSYTYDTLGRRLSEDDPDKGTRAYVRNRFGEPTLSLDSDGEATLFGYDGLGRMVSAFDGEGLRTYEYDQAPSNGVGRLSRATSQADNTAVDFHYDSVGRLTAESHTIDGAPYVMGYTYDGQSRLSRVTYPTMEGQPFAVDLSYSANNHMQSVVDAHSGVEYWRLRATSPTGAPSDFGLPGANQINTYDAQTGRIASSTTVTPGSGAVVRDRFYTYNAEGLLSFATEPGTRQEEFAYDALGRPNLWRISQFQAGGWQPTHAQSYAYDAIGNLTLNRTGALSYSGAGGAGPHAVTAAGGDTFQYDTNGRRKQSTANGGWKATYTSDDLPRRFTTLNDESRVHYKYSPFGERVVRQAFQPIVETSTQIRGGLFERITSAAGTKHIYRIQALGREVARVEMEDGVQSTYGIVQDKSGSASLVIDATTLQTTSYYQDPWGAQTNVDGVPLDWSMQDRTTAPTFTGHRYADVGTIDMGGRVYDPTTAQFLSTDPIFPSAHSAQGMNPYGYVLNQPTRYVDPTGFQQCDTPSGRCGGDGGGSGQLGAPGASGGGAWQNFVNLFKRNAKARRRRARRRAKRRKRRRERRNGPDAYSRAGTYEQTAVADAPRQAPSGSAGASDEQLAQSVDTALPEDEGPSGFAKAANAIGYLSYVPGLNVGATAVEGLLRVLDGDYVGAASVLPNFIPGAKIARGAGKAAGVLGAAARGLRRGVRRVNGRLPINHRFAGRVLPASALPKAIRGKYPHGVPFNAQGFPDFSRYEAARVRIKLQGTRPLDEVAANRAAGLPSRPAGYTWHHHQDAGLMQLVPTDLHHAVRHTGGIATSKAP